MGSQRTWLERLRESLNDGREFALSRFRFPRPRLPDLPHIPPLPNLPGIPTLGGSGSPIIPTPEPMPGISINPFQDPEPRDSHEMQLLDRMVRAVTGETIEANARHFARELGNAPESYAECLKDLGKCADKTAARLCT